LSASLCECRDSLAELTQQLSPRDIILCGSCSGGAVATYLAAERQDTHSLILYESPPRFPQWTRDDFVVRAKQLGMVLSRDFLNEYIDTIDKAPEVSCPVLICWGTGTRPPIFVPEDGRLLADEFSNASHIGTKEYPAADHNVFRGSNARVLHTILKDIVAFVESDALQPSMSQALPAH
jgi:pimeloyl-ACP methyl ester carboxylesterase